MVWQGFSGRFDEESDDGQVLFDLGPFHRCLVRSLGAYGFQEIRQSGETAARIWIAGTRGEHDVTIKSIIKFRVYRINLKSIEFI